MPESIPASVTASQQAKYILVVEDNIALRFALAGWLRKEGYVVLEAASADEAVTVLSSPITVDFVVTDVQMPGEMNGIDLVWHIHHSFTGLPVLVVSGEDVKQELRDGNVPFFKKPYDLNIISSHIKMRLDLFADGEGLHDA